MERGERGLRHTGSVLAVSYSASGSMPVLDAWPDPACPEDGVVIRVGATGLCRSDWHAWMGHDPVPLPHVPGHELAGAVHAIGPGVTLLGRGRPGHRAVRVRLWTVPEL